jgi:hypothetical protein
MSINMLMPPSHLIHVMGNHVMGIQFVAKQVMVIQVMGPIRR